MNGPAENNSAPNAWQLQGGYLIGKVYEDGRAGSRLQAGCAAGRLE